MAEEPGFRVSSSGSGSAGDEHFHWPPCRGKFLLAWALFAIALALTGFKFKEEHGGPAGLTCLIWSWQYLGSSAWDLVLTDHHVSPNDLYYGSIGIANSVFLLSIIVTPIMSHRAELFRIGYFVSAIATLDVLAWFVHTGRDPDLTSREGAYVWACAFVALTWAFVAAAKQLAKPMTPA